MGIKREIYRKNEGLQDVFYESDTKDKAVVQLLSRKGNSTRYKFPAVHMSLRTRWCSSCVKIQVASRMIASAYKTGDYIVATGERRLESSKRNKYKNFENHTTNTRKRKVIHFRPILEATEKQVWSLFKKYKVQPHPCYELGWSRCSCKTCIFSSANT